MKMRFDIRSQRYSSWKSGSSSIVAAALLALPIAGATAGNTASAMAPDSAARVPVVTFGPAPIADVVAAGPGPTETLSLDGRRSRERGSDTPPQLTSEDVLPGYRDRDHPFGGSVNSRSSYRLSQIRQGGTATGGAGFGPFLDAAGSCSWNVTNHGGRILANPRIHRVFWGNYWTQQAHAAEASRYDQTWTNLANSPSFYTRLSEYGVSPGSAGGHYDLPAANTGSVSEATITSTLTAMLQSTGTTPGGGDLFVVFLPSGTTNDRNIANNWSGHHDHFSYDVPLGWYGYVAYDVAYAVIEYSSDPTYTNPVVSHEISEAASDADLNAWFATDGSEIGDICRFAYNNVAGSQVESVYSQKSCRCVRERDLASLDYTGAGKPMPTVFRSGTWYGLGATSYWNFGEAGDIPLPGDYDGDGRTEYALFRGATHNWFVLNTQTGYYNYWYFGDPGDVPVPADYDGDGKTDIAVFRPSNGTWYVISSATGQMSATQWGASGDVPVPGDFDNDGKADIAVWRPSNGTWYVLPSASPGFYTWAQWGTSGDIPVQGDFNGDGKADWTVFRPSEGRWYTWFKDTNSAIWTQWGEPGDVPVARDYDGDWKSDIAVWRPSNGTWYILNSGGGSVGIQWGTTGDIPVEKTD